MGEVGKTSADDAIVAGPSFEAQVERASLNEPSRPQEVVPPMAQLMAQQPSFKPIIPPPPIIVKQPKETKREPKKKKKRKTRAQRMREMNAERIAKLEASVNDDDDDENEVEVEYVPEDLGLDVKTANYRIFSKIFEAFKSRKRKRRKRRRKKRKRRKTQRRPKRK